MDKMKLIYSLCVGISIVSLVPTLTWRPMYTWARWLGFLLILSSILIAYYIYKKEQKLSLKYDQINLNRACLGFSMIITDILYNTIMKEDLYYFDYGVIIVGLIIVLININWLKFLRLDEKMIAFASYFLLITLMLYGISFKGLNIFFKNTDIYTPFWDWFCINVVHATLPIFNFIKPTTSYGTIINFDNFCVNVAYPCSGLESISVFFAAVIAYFISIKEYNIGKITKYIVIGFLILYPINIMRIVTIVLIGYYYGNYTMMIVHSYLGMIIFVLSMSVFWYIVLQKKNELA